MQENTKNQMRLPVLISTFIVRASKAPDYDVPVEIEKAISAIYKCRLNEGHDGQ